MGALLLACEALRVELESIVSRMENPPEIIYLPQKLHDDPNGLRAGLREKILEIEKDHPEVDEILMSYGLCGRGAEGVCGTRATLVFPRVHDCIPLYLGANQKDTNEATHNGLIFWLCAGAMEYSTLFNHIIRDRYKLYSDKFGEERARKLIRAENAVYGQYKGARFIRWPDMDEKYEKIAHQFAEEVNLEYSETEGNEAFLRELLAGGHDPEKFLRIKPGQSLAMDTDGAVIAIELAKSEYAPEE